MQAVQFIVSTLRSTSFFNQNLTGRNSYNYKQNVVEM